MRHSKSSHLIALLMCIMFTICSLPFAVFADDVKVVGDKTFQYDSETGYYVWVDGLCKYVYVDQEVIDANNGKIPFESFDQPQYTYYSCYVYVADDIKVSGAELIDDEYFYGNIFIEPDKTITYEPSGYWWMDPLFPIYSGSLVIETYYGSNATIKCPTGALIASIGCTHSYGSTPAFVTFKYLTLEGHLKNPECSGELRGGATYVDTGYVEFVRCEIKDFGTNNGGAALVDDGIYYDYYGNPVLSSAVFQDTYVHDCKAVYGGAVYAEGMVTLLGSPEFDGNYASDRGGAICAEGENACIEFSGQTLRMYDNTCDKREGDLSGGGAIYINHPGATDYYLRLNNRVDIFENFDGSAFRSNIFFESCSSDYDCVYADNGNDIASDLRIGISMKTFTYGKHLYVTKADNYSTWTDYSEKIKFDRTDIDMNVVLEHVKGGPYIYKTAGSDPVLLEGYSLILNGTGLGIKFHVYIPDSYEVGTSEEPLWKASVGPKQGYALRCGESEPRELDVDGFKKDGSDITFTYTLDSTDMMVPLIFNLSYNGETVIGDKEVTVKSYIDVLYSGRYGEDAKKKAAAVAVYGAAAQNYFDFMTDAVPDSGFDPADRLPASLPSQVNNQINKIIVPQSKPVGDKISLTSMTVSFVSTPNFKVYFTSDTDIDDDKFSITIDNQDINVIVKRVNSKKYCLMLVGLTSKQCMKGYGIKVYYDGALQFNYTISPVKYAQMIMNKTTNPAMKNLAIAYMIYCYTTQE